MRPLGLLPPLQTAPLVLLPAATRAGTVAPRIALYSLAMIACAVAPDVDTLIAIRVVQGVGMAMFLPATFAMAAAAYPAGERGRALGVRVSDDKRGSGS